ncbi:ABC transporter ATP-binding protein [Enemella evansiae]|uniref:ABC transporter ATP-binding protein n=1 Tax=Enemella evansiae TaxID=2016499 RepID=UPI000B962E47|nr:ATP-binding cassette domain-containing protein [Enemella evansiae]OYN97136.1 proline/glycine betaine ABC transporter ATP-binding protein [Enemella evansiae]OYO06671.1 proline/glycine betaine ABC transporter ATP-binding protein [Enemella evansiae]
MIEFKSVSKTYSDGTKAVEDLSLVVPSDGTTVMVGPSGCGKTTLLRMVNRMIEPTAGSVEWDGTPIKRLKKTVLRRQMGYVIQNGGLFPHRTILENIGTVPELLGWDDRKTHARAQELLELVGLEPQLGRRFPAQLSGGQQQRVGVARALAADPDLLLMDEPFSAVDPVVRADLQELVKRLQTDLKKTILMITHDMDEAITMGNQVAVLQKGGHLAQFDTPEEILDNPASEFVADFVGRDRGYRSLTFAGAPELKLERVRTVRNAAFERGEGRSDEPVLVVDGEGRPQGWADPQRPGRLLGLGSTFTNPGAPLREVVEAALTSPTGLAVAVGADGRYAGVISDDAVMQHVRAYRAGVAESQVTRQIRSEEDAEAARIEAERQAAEQAADQERRRAEAEALAEQKRSAKGRRKRRGGATAVKPADAPASEQPADVEPEGEKP